jgi:hypothetical protein
MDFVKKHYEKILLSVVLLGLMGALVFMLYLIPREQQRLEEKRMSIISHAVRPLDPLDLSRESNILVRLKAPLKLDFSTTNRLFNPVQWQRAADGSLIKIKTGSEIGPRAVAITKITPLCLVLTLDSIETNELGARFVIGVERQAAPYPGQRIKRQHYASVGDKNETFTLIDATGSPADPSQVKLVLQLIDTGEKVTLDKATPFRRVDGYSADLKYDPEQKKWQGMRVNGILKFNFDENKIVAINQDTVILLARSNEKKTPLTYTPSP